MTLNCKSCGAPITIEPADEKIKCEYCKTEALVSMLLYGQGPTASDDSDRWQKRLRRAALCLLDGEADKAEQLYEQILAEEPECSPAYVGLLLIRLGLREESSLTSYPKDLMQYQEFCRAREFATGTYRQQLEQWYSESINLITYKGKKDIYVRAANKLSEGGSSAAVEAQIIFEQLGDFEDSAQMAVVAAEKANEYTQRECAELRNAVELREQAQRAAHKSVIRWSIACVVLAGLIIVVGIGASAYNRYVGLPQLQAQIDTLIATSQYDDAILLINSTNKELAFAEQLRQAEYGQATYMEARGFYTRAWLLYKHVGSYKDAAMRADNIVSLAQPLSDAYGFAMALRSDGTVDIRQLSGNSAFSSGFSAKQKAVSEWQNIVKVAVSGDYLLGLRQDGTVACFADSDYAARGAEIIEISQWRDIVNIDARHDDSYVPRPIAGLKRDGTVVAEYVDDDAKQLISTWQNVKNIACGTDGIAAVTADGCVLSSIADDGLQAIVSEWSGMVAVATDGQSVAAITADGSVRVVYREWLGGNKFEWQHAIIPLWDDMVSVSVHSYGLSYQVYGVTRKGTVKMLELLKNESILITTDVGAFRDRNWYLTKDGAIPLQLIKTNDKSDSTRQIW